MGLVRNWQRRRICQQPFPAPWEVILARDVPFLRRLTPDESIVLRSHIKIFLAEKAIIGCDGLLVTDEMRIIIAAYACLLLLHLDSDFYPALGSVVVYPSSFAAQVSVADASGIVTEGTEERLGESWEEGAVVLAWDSICEGLKGRTRGLNVILHEFAHQLDAEHNITNGTPLRQPGSPYQNWEEICTVTYTRMRHDRRRGRPLVLDPYGASSAAEFFAVATETFFEQPLRLKAHHSDLYAELQAIYRQDPARSAVS